MSEYLVLPRRHHLIPLAWRLKGEGHTVGVLPRSDRYERAWDGLFDKAFKGQEKRDREEMAQLVEMAKTGQFTILTDCEKWQAQFEGAERVFGPTGENPIPNEWRPAPVQVGAWRTGDGRDILPHLIVRDLGAWPGGMGPCVTAGVLSEWWGEWRIPAGLAPAFEDEGWEVEVPPGLWQRDIIANEAGVVSFGAPRGGWELWQSQLLLSQVESLGGLLEDRPQGEAKGRFAAALAVSVPPWPNDKARSAPVLISGPSREQRQSVLSWFDVRKVGEMKVLETAELDGLVAIARVAANSIQWAGAQVLDVAQAFELPERQYRPDLGTAWNLVQGQLGRLGLLD